MLVKFKKIKKKKTKVRPTRLANTQTIAASGEIDSTAVHLLACRCRFSRPLRRIIPFSRCHPRRLPLFNLVSEAAALHRRPSLFCLTCSIQAVSSPIRISLWRLRSLLRISLSTCRRAFPSWAQAALLLGLNHPLFCSLHQNNSISLTK